MSPSITKRYYWLDIAKGITIILMVLGHSSIPKFVSDFIWAFHMPLFFIASGWCTDWKRDGFVTFLKKRTKSLMFPFCVFSLVVMMIYQILGKRDCIDILQNGWGGYALWFVPVLFFATLLAKAVFMIWNTHIQIFAISGVVSLAYVTGYFRPELPWTLYSIPYACTFILIGSAFRRMCETQSKGILLPRFMGGG